MAEWEGLDVDDSDLVQRSLPRPSPSPLLPSKRTSKSPSRTRNLPSLEPCSQFTPRFSLNLSQPNATPPPSKTISLTHQHSQLPCPEETRVSSKAETRTRHRIPGPAGSVQMAMSKDEENRTSRRRRTSDSQHQQQEKYLTPKSGTENEGDHCDDEDFKKNSWLCAVDFLLTWNMENGIGGSALQFPISSIKTCRKRMDRVPLVIGIIKSCKQNGLGDLFVTLKDPTGTIGATMHHKVLADGKFGRDISVGCAVILQQVAVFSPTRSVHYLNITLDNVVKVINKDCSPPPKQAIPPFAFRRAASDEPREFGPAQASKAAAMSEEFDSVSRAANNIDDDGSRHGLQDLGIVDGQVGRNAVDDEVVAMEAIISSTKTELEVGGRGGGLNTEKLVETRPCCETGTLGAIKRVIPSISLGHWTDEQIDELFAHYDEEDTPV